MARSLEKSENSNLHPMGGRRATWFLRGILVAAVTHSLLATADLSVETESFLTDFNDPVELHDRITSDSKFKIIEVDLPDTSITQSPLQSAVEKPLVSSVVIVPGIQIQKAPGKIDRANDRLTLSKTPQSDQIEARKILSPEASKESKIHFPLDVPESEILRVSRTFHGMIQESLGEKNGPFAEEFLGSLATSELMTTERLAELETSLIDENVVEDGYAVGEELELQIETKGLDPFKTYTVINGRIHAVSPTKVVSPRFGTSGGAQNVLQLNARAEQKAADLSVDRSHAVANGQQAVQFNLPQDEISKSLEQILSTNRSAALDKSSVQSGRVTVQGKVIVPHGFAPDKVVLRLGGTAFQVQTDASGAFELRDVPRGTRFELLVWHLDGSLTRRLIPVTASGREKFIEISLQKLSDVDALAGSFGVVQQMNYGGFCARVDNNSPDSLVGARVEATSGRKNLQVHFFSNNGLPSTIQSELSTDGRICVFNVDESIVDVKVSLVNGVRRQFVVHVEPTTFEHDLLFDVAESIYRRVTLMEPLDTQQVLELSSQGIQPDFGDRELRDWLQGNDVPVWTPVSRYVLQSDPAYSFVRSNPEEVVFFPGGQEFVEVRLTPDVPGSPLSRVLVSRDQLLTEPMLKRLDKLKTNVVQDPTTTMSIAALDADAWDDIVIQTDVPRLDDHSVGGVYLSIDPEGLGIKEKDLIVSVRDTWTGKDVCSVQPLRSSREIKSGRFLRAACGVAPGQFALIIESKDGALLWSDVVRVRAGDVQTVTVLDPKF